MLPGIARMFDSLMSVCVDVSASRCGIGDRCDTTEIVCPKLVVAAVYAIG